MRNSSSIGTDEFVIGWNWLLRTRWNHLRTCSSAPARRGWSYSLHQSVLLPRQAASYSFRCHPLVGFSCFSAIFTPSHNLPNIPPLYFLGVASKSAFHDAQCCCHDFQRRVSVQVCVCGHDKETLVLSSGFSYRLRHWRRRRASACALLWKHVGTLAAGRTAAQPHMFISFTIT